MAMHSVGLHTTWTAVLIRATEPTGNTLNAVRDSTNTTASAFSAALLSPSAVRSSSRVKRMAAV